MFADLKTLPNHPGFLRRVFRHLIRESKASRAKKDPLEIALLEEYGYLSWRLDKSEIQESLSVRNVLLTRKLAELLIPDTGELDLEKLAKAIQILKKHLYFLTSEKSLDGKRRLYLLMTLQALLDNKNLQRALKMITAPESNKFADQILRETLQTAPHEPITHTEARRAVLSALLCLLRQSVGSCFGTAPAILVQKELPELFLQDMNEILSTGRLKRTFGGVEYAAPLSKSMGAGDLRKPILIPLPSSKEVESELLKISIAPGFLKALEASFIIDSKLALPEKVLASQKAVLEALKAMVGESKGVFITNAENILKQVLMIHLEVTEKGIQEYENRPRELMFNPAAPVRSSRSENIHTFFTKFELAKTAFKTFAENALLKSWEFTVASFAETKPSFSRWNMYASLGFSAEEKGGIGECLYNAIREKLENSNRKVQEIQDDYEFLFQQLKMIEGRMRSVSSEKEAQWIRVEYESKRNEFRSYEAIRDKEHFKARRYANLLNDLLISYDELFPSYFQEVYDADMHEVTSSPYDDSPAGFRLLYKHGRVNTSQWTLIYTPNEFIDALSSFFTATEIELVNDPVFEGLQEDISSLVTSLISLIKTDDFLVSAFSRMAKAHNTQMIKDPLHHLDKIEKKPWAYTSGGTMNNLIKSYFKLDKELTETGRWVENEMELLVFLIDTLKQMPGKKVDEYISESARLSEKGLLAHSPTHAFRVIPSYSGLKKAVLSEGYTYTYVRDHLIQPRETFVDYMFLDESMMEAVILRLAEELPAHLKDKMHTLIPHVAGKKTPPEFFRFLSDFLDKERITALSEAACASKLYAFLPLVHFNELRNRMEKVAETLPLTATQKAALEENIHEIADLWPSSSPYVFADTLQELVLAALLATLKETTTEVNFPQLIAETAAKLGYAMPLPLFFADTNWAREDFAFAVSPLTGKLSLWRFEYTGRVGFPLLEWDMWLNGSRKDRTWALYPKPEEYR